MTKMITTGTACGSVNAGTFHGYIDFEDANGKEIQVDGEFKFDFNKEAVLHTHYNEDGSVNAEVVITNITRR